MARSRARVGRRSKAGKRSRGSPPRAAAKNRARTTHVLVPVPVPMEGLRSDREQEYMRRVRDLERDRKRLRAIARMRGALLKSARPPASAHAPSDVRRLEKDLRASRERLAVLKGVISALRRRGADGGAKMDAAREAMRELASAKTLLERDLSKKTREVSALERNIAAERERASRLGSTAEKNAEIARLVAKEEVINKELESLRQRLAGVEGERDAVRKRYNGCKAEREAGESRARALEGELKTCKEGSVSKDAAIQERDRDLGAKASHIAKLTKQLEDAVALRDITLKSALETAKRETDLREGLEERVGELGKEIEDNWTALERASRAKTALEGRVRELVDRGSSKMARIVLISLRMLKEMRLRDESSRDAQQKAAEIQRLGEELAKSAERGGERSKSEETISAMREAIRVLTGEKASAEAATAERDSEIARLTLSLSNGSDEERRLRDAMQKKEAVINELKNTVISLRAFQMGLGREKKNIAAELGGAKKEASALAVEVGRLRERVATVLEEKMTAEESSSRRNSEASREKENLRVQQVRTQEALDAATKRVEDLLSEKREMERSSNALTNRIASLEGKISENAGTIRVLRETGTLGMEQKNNRIAELVSNLEKQRSSVTALTKERDELKANIVTLEDVLKGKEHSIEEKNRLKEEKSRLEQDVKTLKNQISALESRMISSNIAITTERDELKAKVTLLEGDVKGKDVNIRAKNRLIGSKNINLAAATAREVQLTADRTRLEQERNTLKKRISEIESKVSSNKAESNAQALKIRELQASFDEKNIFIHKIEESKRANEETIRTLRSNASIDSKQRETLKGAVEEQKKRIEALEQRVAVNKERIKTIEDMKKEGIRKNEIIAYQGSQLETRRTEVDSLKANAEVKSRELKTIGGSLAAADAAKGEWDKTKRELNEKRDAQVLQLEGLQASLRERNLGVRKIEQNRRANKEIIRKLEHDASTHSQRIATLEALERGARTAKTAAEERIKTHEAEITALSAEIKLLKESVEKAKRELGDAAKAGVIKNDRVSALETALVAANARISTLEAETRALREADARATKLANDLNEQLKNKQASLKSAEDERTAELKAVVAKDATVNKNMEHLTASSITIINLERSVKAKQREITMLEGKMVELQAATNAEMERKKNELEGLRETINGLQSRLANTGVAGAGELAALMRERDASIDVTVALRGELERERKRVWMLMLAADITPGMEITDDVIRDAYGRIHRLLLPAPDRQA